MQKPKVSIIVPCFNQEPFLDETLASVFEQTHENWECIVVDDGSTDHSAHIADKWCSIDKRFVLLKKENGGLSSARNFGLQRAQGEYIQFLDGDDLLYKNKLLASLADQKEDIVITSFNHVKKGKITAPFCQLRPDYFNYDSILLEWDRTFSIPIHCGLFKADLLRDFQFNEILKAGEDWLFWLHIYQKNPSTKFIDEELVCYRLHDKSMTQDALHMSQNKQLAHLMIFDTLDDEFKKKFFDRFSLEALWRREEMTRIYKKKEQKLSRKIKRFFKRKK